MIAVVGGTGTIGSRVVEELTRSGQEVLVLSRRTPDQLPPGATHQRFDMTADEPAPLLAGSKVLVDLANNSSRPKGVLLEGTSRLLDTCAVSGIGHYVGISIVGCDQLDLAYYKAKARQEELIRNSPVPWSLLQATQFHELIDGLMAGAARIGLLPAGRAKLQPVASAEVGARLCQLALTEPLEASERLVGPEVSTLGELAATWKAVNGRRCLELPLPLAGRIGRDLRNGVLTDPTAPAAGPGFEQWLRD